MRLGHLELFVRNPLQAKDFYTRALGFEVVVEQGEATWLRAGDLEILLRPGRKAPEPATYAEASTGHVLYTDDLEGAATRLRECGVEFGATDGSDRCLTFADPDGNWFQLVNPGDH